MIYSRRFFWGFFGNPQPIATTKLCLFYISCLAFEHYPPRHLTFTKRKVHKSITADGRNPANHPTCMKPCK